MGGKTIQRGMDENQVRDMEERKVAVRQETFACDEGGRGEELMLIVIQAAIHAPRENQNSESRNQQSQRSRPAPVRHLTDPDRVASGERAVRNPSRRAPPHSWE